MTAKRQQIPPKGTAIVYSFKSKWSDLITQGRINLFFRKNAPAAAPARVYFYVGSPVKQITGWSDVTSIDSVSCDEALSMSSRGLISPGELALYLKARSSVNVIRTGLYHPLSRPVGLEDIQQSIVFHPPQSFCVLTPDDERVIQELGV